MCMYLNEYETCIDKLSLYWCLQIRLDMAKLIALIIENSEYLANAPRLEALQVYLFVYLSRSQ